MMRVRQVQSAATAQRREAGPVMAAPEVMGHGDGRARSGRSLTVRGVARRAVLVSVVVVVGLLCGGAQVAVGEGSWRVPLSVSVDGRHFVRGPVDPLLVGVERFAPGDTDRRRVWVRNDSGQVAWFWSSYRFDRVDAGLGSFVRVAGAYLPEPVEMVRVGPVDQGQCRALVPSRRVDPGGVVVVEVAAGLVPEAPNSVRGLSAGFSVRFGLAEDVGQGGVDGCTAPVVDPATPSTSTGGDSLGGGAPALVAGGGQVAGGGGSLAVTGVPDLLPWLVVVGGVLVAGGVAVVLVRRAKTRDRVVIGGDVVVEERS